MLQPLRMAPRRRRTLQVVGLCLLVAGLLLFTVGGLLPMFALIGGEPDEESFRAFGASIVVAVLVTGLAMFMILGGAICAALGFRKPMAELAATDTELAVEHASAALGRGLARGGVGGGQRVVRVKCRSCGHLEAEDAAYCSKCGKAV